MDHFEQQKLRQEWLNNLKAGDEVAIGNSGWGPTVYNFYTVDRTTSTQIIVGNSKYRRDGGQRIGAGTWDRSPPLKQPTDEMKKAQKEYLHRQKLLRIIEIVEMKNLATDELESVVSIIEKYVDKK